jgi:hypothetical protein
MNVKKYISVYGVTLEIGDFYGGGEDEAITSMEQDNQHLKVNTGMGFYDLALKPGDYLSYVDGSSILIKSKFDKQDE